MPGLFGVIYKKSKIDKDVDFAKIEKLLMHQSWYGSFSYKYKHICIGAVSTSPYFKSENNYYEDDSLIVLIEGNGITLSNGHIFNKSMPIAKEIAILYKNNKQEFIREITGSYNLFIFDKEDESFGIWNDQFGFSYLYYYHTEDVLIFGPEIKVFLAYSKFDKQLDECAIASYFISNVIIGNRTFFKNAKLLPSASKLSLEGGNLRTDSYWKPSCDSDSGKDPEEFIRSGAELYKKSLLKKIPQDKNKRIVMPLSGGLDSRLILKLLSEERTNLTIYTHGNSRCLDYKIAKRVAGKLDLAEKHQLVDIDPSWMGSANALKTVWLNECNVDYRSTYLNEIAMQLSPGTDTLINGIIGAHMSMGSDKVFSENEIGKIDDQDTIRRRMKAVMDMPENSDRLKEMLQDEIAEDFLHSAEINLLNEFSAYQNNELFCDQKDMFLQFNLGRRMMGNVNLNKFYFHDVLPFVDSELFNLYCEIPPQLKINHHLYQEMFKQLYPDMAGIAWASTGVNLFSERGKKIKRKFNQLIDKGNYYAKRLTFGLYDPIDSKTYLYREKWLRTNQVFRKMINSNFKFAQDNEIPFLAADKLDHLMAMHDAGRDYIFNRIVRVFSFIVWYRLFILEDYDALLD
ncbi:MAG: hypothetical protein AB2598_08630 [Candidatus Thiodiazotropha sp.]